MEALFRIPFAFLTVPNLKLRKPTWLVQPSAMVVFALCLFSYFLVTAGNYSKILIIYFITLLNYDWNFIINCCCKCRPF